MSGGKEKKSSRGSKAQGWEEAGSEFYQESYPGDIDNIQRDPSKLATLLPSKQRVGEFFCYKNNMGVYCSVGGNKYHAFLIHFDY